MLKLWEARGFISQNEDFEMKLALTDELTHGKTILNCFLVLHNYDNDFYDKIERVLYPLLVYYTKRGNTLQNGLSMASKIVEFCENTIDIKYDFDCFDSDYELCKDFISLQ